MSKEIVMLPGEKVVMRSDKDILVLTNMRVRHNSTVFGKSIFNSITLDCIASCSLITKSAPITLILGAGALLYAFNNKGGMQSLFFILAIGAVITYFLVREKYISIASNGGDKILLPAKTMDRDSIITFFDAVEREKLQLININT